ncbi:unnamed protein product [Cuscuta campestris]|uniref:Uncharacterized protein n=1 Tax=Cuscuta campestris TaxID=132261 RepID=A0A484M306_9ASTE|nr:unnamed protein product [Cuscuta campestris]
MSQQVGQRCREAYIAIPEVSGNPTLAQQRCLVCNIAVGRLNAKLWFSATQARQRCWFHQHRCWAGLARPMVGLVMPLADVKNVFHLSLQGSVCGYEFFMRHASGLIVDDDFGLYSWVNDALVGRNDPLGFVLFMRTVVRAAVNRISFGSLLGMNILELPARVARKFPALRGWTGKELRERENEEVRSGGFGAGHDYGPLDKVKRIELNEMSERNAATLMLKLGNSSAAQPSDEQDLKILDGMDTAEQDMNVVNYTADITTEVAPESAVQVTSEDGRDATGKGLEMNNQVAKEGDSAKGGMDSAKRSSMEELGARNVDIRVEDKNDVGEKHILEEIESVGQDIYVENISKQINAEIAPMSEVDVTPEKTKGTSDVAPLLNDQIEKEEKNGKAARILVKKRKKEDQSAQILRGEDERVKR